jgi:hypothetical protein
VDAISAHFERLRPEELLLPDGQVEMVDDITLARRIGPSEVHSGLMRSILLPDAPPDEAVLSVAGKSYSVRAVAEAFEVAPSTAAARLAKARAKE